MKSKYLALSIIVIGTGAHAFDENADGVQVGGYVDMRYVWQKGDFTSRVNQGKLNEGAIYAGAKLGGSRAFIDADLNQGLNLIVAQAFVAHESESGCSFKAGRFDGIFGWLPNDSSQYQLSTRGIIQAGVSAPTGAAGAMETNGGLPKTQDGLMFGHTFSDKMKLQLVVAAESSVLKNGGGTHAHDFDTPEWGLKFESQLGGLDLGLGFRIENADGAIEGNAWGVDAVIGAKLSSFDVRAIFVTGSAGKDLDTTMGFGAQVGTDVVDGISAAARVEWAKLVKDGSVISFTAGPQFRIADGFALKADYLLISYAGDAFDGTDASHAVNIAAIADF